MPTHLDPAFLDPTPAPKPVEKDPDTLDIFDVPVEESPAPVAEETE